MEITKKILVRELAEILSSQTETPVSYEKTVDNLFTLIERHVSQGDIMNFSEFSVRPKTQHGTSDTGSHNAHGGRRRRNHSRESRHYSSNFIVNELSLMINDDQYFLSKTGYFLRNTGAVVVFVVVYYMISVLVGC